LKKKAMTEEFLHYIWKSRNFDLRNLTTTAGEEVEVIRPGEYNSNAGPDFFNARIKIGGTLWAGNVELHLRASDWTRHRHQTDRAYDTIILHVVHEADESIVDKAGKAYATIELTGRIHSELYKKYLAFRGSTSWNPCGKQAGETPPIVSEAWMERLLVERLQRKAERILDSLKLNQNNWEESFYHQLARNFGFGVNAVPFELLAKSVPFILFSRYRDNLFQLEALLFGQAGLLENHFQESYAQRLQSEYRFLAHKHKLQSMEGSLWKFMRLRPLNFPTVRIAQFAKLLHNRDHLFSGIQEAPSLFSLRSMFSSGVSAFWTTHYHFDSESPQSPKQIGQESVENIIINTVVPFLFVSGMQKGEQHSGDFVLELLGQLKPENNRITRNWKALGLDALNAGRSQSLNELRECYCVPKRCLDCAIGRFLLKRETDR
jgi:hypothetical protein